MKSKLVSMDSLELEPLVSGTLRSNQGHSTGDCDKYSHYPKLT